MGRKMQQKGKVKLQGHDLFRVKGKLPAIQDHGQIEPIKDIYMIKDPKSTYKTLYIHGKEKDFLGIVISRQSSDFLALVAQKMVKKRDRSIELPIVVLQYPFPTYSVGVSLLAITQWEDAKDLDRIFTDLRAFQKEFRQNLYNILE
jgi:hypothetical protein